MAKTIRLQRLDDRMRIVDEWTFNRSFKLGRGAECDITIDHASVSREHLMIFLQGNHWWIRDLGSTNGTILDDVKVEMLPLNNTATLEVGKKGPRLKIIIEESAAAPPAPAKPAKPPASSLQAGPGRTTRLDATTSAGVEPLPESQQLHQRYFGEEEPQDMGDRTMIIRREYGKIRKRQRTRTITILTVSLILIGAISGYAWHKHRQTEALKTLAEEAFYQLQEMRVEIANLRHQLASAGISFEEQFTQLQVRQAQMEQRYDQMLGELGVYGKTLSREDSLILKITRTFGECEVNMPSDYFSEVKRYIAYWQSSRRFVNAIKRAEQYNFAERTKEIMLGNHLPPEFFYLALQESNFKPQTVGPSTSFGYAKGIWQFIPKTARKYGLQTGPLVDKNVYDPRDERFDFDKACTAAAQYINDIYRTECQASGLLVMASYNWGEHRILERLRQLPENPRERNFWKLLRDHKIPEETYKYVLYIISATVIGEDPRLFGFDVDNPLKT